MAMKKKICLLGAFAVGKTSLVEQFVRSIFSERYQTTVGVKIEKKVVSVEGDPVTLVVWDLHGEDQVHNIRDSYLRGSNGILLVADGTRAETLQTATALKERVDTVVGSVPCALLINKADLPDEWEITDAELESLRQEGWTLLLTSAKTGAGVEDAFLSLARNMIATP